MELLTTLEKYAVSKPHSLFLVDDLESYTFNASWKEVNKVASGLQHLGLVAHDRVVLCFQNRAIFLFSYLGCLLAGVVPVMVDPQSRLDFVQFALAETGAKLLVNSPERLEFKSLTTQAISYDEIIALGKEKFEAQGTSAIAYLIFTSGTTGKPKAVTVLKSNVIFTARAMIKWADMKEGERELICLRLSHSFGLGMFHANLLLGNQIFIFHSARDLFAVMNNIEHDRIAGFSATPAILKLLTLQHSEQFFSQVQCLKRIVVNTSPLDVATASIMVSKLPQTKIYMYYGLTEASRSTVVCYNDHPEKMSTVGRAVEGVEVKIGEAQHSGLGEIFIRGPNVMCGYWGMSREECFDEEGWFPTGDLGSIDDSGFVTILGRVKEQINVDGLKCCPEEVEKILLTHPLIKECAVCAIPDALTYQQVGAILVTSVVPVDQMAFLQELRKLCKQHLEIYKIPKKFLFCSELPKTDSGKVKRLELQKLFMEEA